MKFLVAGNKYKVSDIKYRSWDGKQYINSIKVEGLSNWFSYHNFRYMNDQEKREVSLRNIFDESVIFTVDKSVRPLDNLDDKKSREIILSIILSAITDPYRNNLSIIDWAIQKTGSKWLLREDDIKPYLNLTIGDIINMMN
jgi:hypothetical protein